MYTAGAQHSSSRLSLWRPAPQENYCFGLTSLVLGGLHQGNGVALPTGGRADPAVGNEALTGTRGSVFFCWYQALAEHSTAAVSRLSLWRAAPQEKLLLCVNVAGPGWASPEKRIRPAHGWKGRPRSWQRSARWYQAFCFYFRWYQALADTPH